MEENEFKIEQNEILEELLEIASDFTKETTLIAITTFILSILYIIIYCCKTNIEKCITNTGTTIPLFIIVSTIIVEVIKMLSILLNIKRRKEMRKIRKFLKEEGKLLGRKSMHDEWEYWYENSRDERKKPKP